MIEQSILDLAEIARHYLMATGWVVGANALGEHERMLLRQRAVCASVIELAEPSPHVWAQTSVRLGPFGGPKVEVCQNCMTTRVVGYDQYPCYSAATLDLTQDLFSAMRAHVEPEPEPEFPNTPEGLRAFLEDYLQYDDEQAGLARVILERLDKMEGD